MKEAMLEKMTKAIVDGNRAVAESLAREAVKNGLDLLEVIEKGFVPGIQKVGELWEKGDYFLPELISSAESMKAAMAVVQPELRRAKIDAPSKGKAVIGTVEGDIHDIGKNLVASMLQAHWFEVNDLGADVKLGKFIDRAQETGADFICLSALLTTTMLGQRRLIEMLNDSGMREQFMVLVGGAPVTQKWADDIGADGYAENALAAVHLALRLMEKKRAKK
ncbi:MAG: corrinoid protein [Clostridiales bacterium]|nr:corrinoid protein [Clostridiales bacterium]